MSGFVPLKASLTAIMSSSRWDSWPNEEGISPASSLKPTSNIRKPVQAPISSGSVSLSLFEETLKAMRLSQLANSPGGMVPLMLFRERSKRCSYVSRPISTGMCPVITFSVKLSSRRLAQLPISGGIFSVRLLDANESELSAVRLQIPAGIAPARFKEATLMPVTRFYPYDSPQVTPCQLHGPDVRFSCHSALRFALLLFRHERRMDSS